MHILIVASLLASVVGLAIWSLSQPKEKLQELWSEIRTPFMNHHTDWAPSFRQWAESLEREPDLKTWLVSLPDEALQALAEKLQEFCLEMGVELEWLLQASADTDPNAKAATEDMVIDYCKICLKALQHQAQALHAE